MVDLPAEEVPAELPEPVLGINFCRDGMERRDWLALVAVHSDAWLLRWGDALKMLLTGTTLGVSVSARAFGAMEGGTDPRPELSPSDSECCLWLYTSICSCSNPCLQSCNHGGPTTMQDRQRITGSMPVPGSGCAVSLSD